MQNDVSDREAILNAIRTTAEQLGRPPSKREFVRLSEISQRRITQVFSSWNIAVKEAGLEANTKTNKLEDDNLFTDWGAVARSLHKLPTAAEYDRHGEHDSSVITRRFGKWTSLPEVFRAWAEGKPEWSDVIALIPHRKVTEITLKPKDSAPAAAKSSFVGLSRHSEGRVGPVYGRPLDFRGLRHAPTNENGVVFLFAIVARELGYMVEVVQAAFPDCEAKRQIATDRWERVRIEFEYESRNFRDHGHPADGCDIIVCWRHNWPTCPESLEIVELESVIKTLNPDSNSSNL